MGRNEKKREIGMRAAAMLQFASKYANVVVQLVVTAVLARLIIPDDFGLLSIVTVFTSFFQLFSDMGIGAAIIQYRDLTERDYGALFAFSAVLAAGLALLFCAAAPAISAFYGDGRLTALCWAVSPAVLFGTLNMVPNGLMLKARRFDAMAIRLVASTIVSGTIAIILAFLGAGCYALVAQTVLSSVFVFAWNYAARPIRCLTMRFMTPLKRVFSYSAYQFLFSFVNYFSRNLDNLVIGRIFGAGALGYYDKAYKLTTYPLSNISSVVASVVQPYMSENQDDRLKIFECWFRIEKLLSLVGAAIAAMFVVAAPEIVTLFYGAQWGDSVPLFRALSVSVYFQMLGNPSGAFFQSLGRTDLMFRQGLVATGLTVAGLLVGCSMGSLQAVAICVSVAFCLQLVPFIYYMVFRGMGVSVSVVFKFVPEVATGIFAVFVCSLVSGFFPSGITASPVFKVFVVGLVMLIGYKLTGQLNVLRSVVMGK